MTLLLDTHVVLWLAREPERLSRAAISLLEDGNNDVVYSVVTVWEVAIKFALKRRDFWIEPSVLRRELRDAGYQELGVTGEHALEAGRLPLLHRDPFDRMLVAQASVEGMVLLTRDPAVGRYGGVVKMV